MTKLTVTQTVEAIRNETTVEGITTVLMDCTKAVMAEVYAELTGGKYCGSLNSRKKAVLALEIAYKVMNARENEAFKAQTVQEKLEHLIDCPYSSQLSLCTQEELKEMAMKLGVYDSDYADEGEEYWLETVNNELRVRMLVKDCRKIAAEGDTDEYGTAKERILFRMMHMPYAVRIRMEEITGVESASLEDAKEQIAEYFLKESVAEDKEKSTMTETCESAPVSQPASKATGVEYEPLTHSQIVFGVKYAATSAANVKAMLMDCEMVSDMFNVYAESTGRGWTAGKDGKQFCLLQIGKPEVLKDWLSGRMSEEMLKYRNPDVLTLEEIEEATSGGKFTAMVVSEKVKYLQAASDLYHAGQWGHDCGYSDMLKQCEVSELEEIARQEGIGIPARIYADKEHVDVHLRWYVNVKCWYVEVGAEEEEYVSELDKAESMLVEVCAGVENYECGKLTGEELGEILNNAPAETLREYILRVIVPEKGRKNAA